MRVILLLLCNGAEGAFPGKAELSVAGPVEAEAYKTHGVAAVEAFLLEIHAYGAVWQYGGGAIG